MFPDHRQSPLKALLNTFGTCHKTHTMTTRYENHDPKDIPPPKTQLPWILCHRNTLCERETVNHLMNTVKKLTLATILAELLEQFWQLKDQFASLKSTTHQSTSTAELTQLTDKLEHLTVMLQLHLAPPAHWGTSTKKHACLHRHLASNTERIRPHYNHAARHPHIWWTRLLKARGLVYWHRNHYWHPNRELHTPGWGQIMQPHLHTHLWEYSKSKVLAWNQRHP